MVGASLAPGVDLRHEVLREGPLAVQPIRLVCWSSLWHHVQLSDVDLATEVSLAVLNDPAQTVGWVVLVKEDDMVLTDVPPRDGFVAQLSEGLAVGSGT